LTPSTIRASLPGGEQIWIETTSLASGTEGDISAIGVLPEPLPIGMLQSAITSLSRVLKDAIDDAKPTGASVEFGIEVGVDSGKLTALLVKGTGKANLKITLSWGAKA
jgi:hypothetical protein